jgi:hypothetical protein
VLAGVKVTLIVQLAPAELAENRIIGQSVDPLKSSSPISCGSGETLSGLQISRPKKETHEALTVSVKA